MSQATRHHGDAPVLVVGAGPAGLILALQLARHGTPCLLVERSTETTRWPKMDITNCRSMELFRKLGIADEYRQQGVGQDWSFDVLFSTGLSDGGQPVAKWDLPSPSAYRDLIRSRNDGSMPREPYQRCSQVILEAWLKPKVQAEHLVDFRFGVKFESLVELEDGVESTLIDIATGSKHTVKSKYVVGCDGANSRVRETIGTKLIGHTLTGSMYLVHFKSRDLTTLRKQGQVWHIFFTKGSVLIAQDEIDTWTIHLPVPSTTTAESLDPEAAIYEALGGSAEPCRVKIDRILVRSVYRPRVCVADRYASSGGRVFLSGDAAHQIPPTGGYGMNTAVGDSFDLGWKVSAVCRGWAGGGLLKSYDVERRPVSERNVKRAERHRDVHVAYVQWAREERAGLTVLADSEDGRSLRARIADHIHKYDGENKEHGIEMDYRYTDSPVVVPDLDGVEPEWDPRNYRPSTFPGIRAPHVFLADGKRSIHDLFGTGFAIVDFSKGGEVSTRFMEAAEELQIPLKRLHLPDETHAAQIWGREVVLIRPDDHVAWRSPAQPSTPVEPRRILKIVTGQEPSDADGNVISKL